MVWHLPFGHRVETSAGETFRDSQGNDVTVSPGDSVVKDESGATIAHVPASLAATLQESEDAQEDNPAQDEPTV